MDIEGYYECEVCHKKHPALNFILPDTVVEVKKTKGKMVEITFRCKEHDEGK